MRKLVVITTRAYTARVRGSVLKLRTYMLTKVFRRDFFTLPPLAPKFVAVPWYWNVWAFFSDK